MKSLLALTFTIKPRVKNKEIFIPKNSLKYKYYDVLKSLDNEEKVYEDAKMDGRIPDVMVPIIGKELKDGTIKSMELEDLDKITVTYEDGNAIRNSKKYKLMIDEALNDHQYLTATFKSGQKGTLVPVYLDRNLQPVKLKTLYKKDESRLDADKVVDEVVSYFNTIGSKYSKYFLIEYGDLVCKKKEDIETKEFLDAVDKVMRSEDEAEVTDNRAKAFGLFDKKMHELLSEPKTRSDAYFAVRRMDSTMRNAMKKSHHKMSDLVVNVPVLEDNTDNYILVDANGQIVMEMGQIVDGKNLKREKVNSKKK